MAVAVEAKFDSGLSNLAEEEPEPERETTGKEPHKKMKNEATGLAIQFSHQLADEYCGIKCGNWVFNKINSIIEPKTFLIEAENTFLLYITGSFELPKSDLREALEIIEDPNRCKGASAKCRQNAGEEMYWVSWRDLSAVIEEAGLQQVRALMGAEYSLGERCLISDVFQMLKIRGMYTFRSFRDLEKVLPYGSIFVDKYFFALIDPVERYESIFKKNIK